MHYLYKTKNETMALTPTPPTVKISEFAMEIPCASRRTKFLAALGRKYFGSNLKLSHPFERAELEDLLKTV